ncbi:MAG: Ig-like domain-containing protein, partial [Acidobacteriota bacterium]|nr:Ig-like domain-containing protein [Acidobacteriota bacterium]
PRGDGGGRVLFVFRGILARILFAFWRLKPMRRARALGFLLALLVLAPACSRRAARIDVSPKRVKIYGLDRPQRLTARLLDKKERPLELGTANWESSKPDVATVDSGGLVTPKAEGMTTITAKYDKVSTQVPVEVVDVKSVEVSPANPRLVGPAGTQIPLDTLIKNSKDRALGLTPMWSSAAPEVATVSPAGIVTSVGPGTSMIVAKVGDVQGACEVTVDVRDIARLELRPATALVRVGDHQQFAVLAYGADGVPIEGVAAVFLSTDPAVAKVDASGKAHGLGAGASTIRAVLGTTRAEATLIVN